jgi:hypothetical protein
VWTSFSSNAVRRTWDSCHYWFHNPIIAYIGNGVKW